MKKEVLLIAYCVTISMLFAVAPVSAANYTQYFNFSSFENSLGGASYTMEDFEGYSHGDNLNGVEFLPGVNVTSNMANITAWNSSGDTILFAYDSTTRQSGNAYYQINLTQDYGAVCFDIDAWYPTGYDGQVDIFFRDSSSVNIPLTQVGSESDPVFFGIVADEFIDKIVWNEPPEIGGWGNEETGLDNIVATNAVPIPGAVWLLASGLISFAGFRKKFKA